MVGLPYEFFPMLLSYQSTECHKMSPYFCEIPGVIHSLEMLSELDVRDGAISQSYPGLYSGTVASANPF